MHFEVIEMRGGTGGKYQGELSKELVELLERFTQTVSLSSPSLKYFLDLKVGIFDVGCCFLFVNVLCIFQKPTIVPSLKAAFQ